MPSSSKNGSGIAAAHSAHLLGRRREERDHSRGGRLVPCQEREACWQGRKGKGYIFF